MEAADVVRKRYANRYMWLIIAIGAVLSTVSLTQITAECFTLYFTLLIAATVVLGSRVSINIPRINTNITVDDAVIFVTLLVYGGPAGVLMGALSGIVAVLRLSRTPRIVLFAGASLATATYVTSKVMLFVFGSTTAAFQANISVALMAACLMGLVQYLTHTVLVAVANALKDNQSIWQMWSRNFLWISITYFTGALVGMLIVVNMGSAPFYAVFFTVPIIVLVFLSYRRYLDDVRRSARQAELAERARGELERERAEQAESHVHELNNYLREQERISRILEETKEHFRHAAFHDSLTGLPNRARFSELLKAEIENNKNVKDHLFAVLFLDLDRFKNINDSMGHTYGDLLLMAFAQRIEKTLRPTDVLARFGGDEFAILASSITNASDAIAIAERIQESLRLPFQLDKNCAFASSSIGIALSSGYTQPEDILRDADIAMYRAKENGKARYEMFDQHMHARAVSRLQLESDLRQAVERQEFCVYYQPIVALDSGKIAGFEALVRWNHPRLGLLQPGEFIEIAEETGMIVSIGQWVLEDACNTVREWQAQSVASRDLTLSVNLSAKQVVQRQLVDSVKQALDRTKFDPRCLKLEITETVVMQNAEAAAEIFRELRKLGVQLSIDDFGTGYSSLSYLHRFPLNYLKIDRSFVNRLTIDHENSIVKTILSLARNLQMEVIAEGIELEEEFDQLRALGCEYGQGYFFSEPVDEHVALKLVRTGLPNSSSPRIEPTQNLTSDDLVAAVA
jgi:diguanylate cyclase (GGDEF)-like protein